MPVNVKVQVSESRLRDTITGLKRSLTPETINRISMSGYEKQALAFLKSVFPDSRKGSGSVSNVRDFGYHLVEGWRVSHILMATTVGFKLHHIGQPNPHIRVILDSLDTGSRAYTYTTGSEFTHFPDLRSLVTERARTSRLAGRKWVTIEEFGQIHHRRHAGVQYTQKTFNFIINVLLPQMHVDVRNVMNQVINRE